MEKSSKKKIAIASALATAALVGGVAITHNKVSAAKNSEASATEGDSKQKRPELSEEKKAEIKEKLGNMTEEEKQAWLESHGSKRKKEGHEKPSDMTDEEWEAKRPSERLS